MTFKPMALAEFDALFPDETACKQYLLMRRWPEQVACPRCGNTKVWEAKHRPWHWICKSPKCLKQSRTGYRFSLYVGTIFENTNYPLLTWFKVLYLMLQSKKGMSALQIHRMIGSGSYRTAWYLSHRLRAGLSDPEFVRLVGIVEVDETFIGGKDKNRHRSKRVGVTGGAAKTAVVGAISRKGNVTCQIIERLDENTLAKFVERTVDQRVKLLATDEWPSYNAMSEYGYRHGVVVHARGEYVR